MLICPRCKKENKDEDIICKSCGFPLNRNKNKLPKGLIVLALMMVFMFVYYNVFYVKTHVVTVSKGKMVTKEEFGETWAFTVDKGYLYSIGKSAIFMAKETEYGINKEAIESGYKDIRESNIWKEDNKVIGERMDIKSFVEIALEYKVE